MHSNDYRVVFHDRIDSINPYQWDALHASQHPFIKHAFLNALEKHNCLQPFGWSPKHITIWDSHGELMAAMPFYQKSNNYGEFVFDQAWEQAWNQIGLPYYPKMVTATPYTPVMGPRLLIRADLSETLKNDLFTQLYESMCRFVEEHNMSGAHILFSDRFQQQELAKTLDNHLYCRSGFQFHWQNDGYECFDDFLQSLKPKKRKNISRERRAVQDAGITFRVLNGLQASDKDWEDFDYFYQKTFLEKWSTPTLNTNFFKDIGKQLAEHIVLVLADQAGDCIAGALMFKSDTHLYGRHWGCAKEVKDLHFETCYYQGIEYAIKHGLQTFEPGAGGEHKIARGFLPTKIDSYHWLPLNPFGERLDDFIQQESDAVYAYLDECSQHSPFKS